MEKHQLLIRPYPNVFESWRGYILRLSEENGVSNPREILRLTDINESEMRTSIPELKHVASIAGKSHNDLIDIYPRVVIKSKMQYLGHIISKQYLRVNSPSLCTECIKEAGYIHARWDFEFMNTCHLHRKALITHCPSCRAKLSWYRRGLLICKCRYDFSEDIGVAASDEEVAFAECLYRVIEGKVDTFDVTSTNIPQAFFSMSANTLLRLFNTLGIRSILSQSKDVVISNVGDRRVFIEGVKILNNWDQEFRRLMTSSTIDMDISHNSIRKRFKNFHAALFKYKFPRDEIRFLEDTYKRISLELTDYPRLDSRMKSRFSIKDEELNCVGVYKAAEILEIMPSTLRKRLRSEVISANEIKYSKTGNYYLIDPHSLPNKKKSELGELAEREAGAYLGLPVRIIKSLRSTGHIKTEYRTIYPNTWAIADLDEFMSRVYKTSLNNSLLDCEDPLDLVYVFQKIKLKSAHMKADILREILDGGILLFAKGKKIPDMYVSKNALYTFLFDLKILKSDQISLNDVKALTGVDNSCIESIIDSNLFTVAKVGRTYFFDKSDVLKFHSEFIALSRLASEYKIGFYAKLRKAEAKGSIINKVTFRRRTGEVQIFLKREEVHNLLCLSN